MLLFTLPNKYINFRIFYFEKKLIKFCLKAQQFLKKYLPKIAIPTPHENNFLKTKFCTAKNTFRTIFYFS